MIKRNRPRSNGGMRTHRNHQNGYSSNPNLKNDDNSEVRLKNRGYYQQMYDKYTTAARESLSLGERIEAECQFQHAEHYWRQLNDRIRYDNEVQQQQQQRHAQQQQAQQNNAKNLKIVDEKEAVLTETKAQSGNVNLSRTNSVRTDSGSTDSVVGEAVTAAEENTSDAEKRPYRKRVLRTPHRRHTSTNDSQHNDTAPASRTASDAKNFEVSNIDLSK